MKEETCGAPVVGAHFSIMSHLLRNVDTLTHVRRTITLTLITKGIGGKIKKLTCSRNLNNKSRRVLKVSRVTEEDVASCDGGFMTSVPLCRWILQTPQRIAPSTHLVACLDQLTSSGTDGPRSSPVTRLVPHRLHLSWRGAVTRRRSKYKTRFVGRGQVCG